MKSAEILVCLQKSMLLNPKRQTRYSFQLNDKMLQTTLHSTTDARRQGLKLN